MRDGQVQGGAAAAGEVLVVGDDIAPLTTDLL